MLVDGLSCLCGVENHWLSTRLAMSSSWISVMQAAVDDLLLMTQILFVVGRSSIDHIFFISGSLLDLLPFLFRVVHAVSLNFLGFKSSYLPKPSHKH